MLICFNLVAFVLYYRYLVREHVLFFLCPCVKVFSPGGGSSLPSCVKCLFYWGCSVTEHFVCYLS